jgi:ribosome recycling factor
MPLNQVATISTPRSRGLLSVQVGTAPMYGAVEKAIRSAGLGLNPISEGQTLRLPIPILPRSGARNSPSSQANMRKRRRSPSATSAGTDGSSQAGRKKNVISEDERKRLETEVQKLTDETTAEIDSTAAAKEKEILQR